MSSILRAGCSSKDVIPCFPPAGSERGNRLTSFGFLSLLQNRNSIPCLFLAVWSHLLRLSCCTALGFWASGLNLGFGPQVGVYRWIPPSDHGSLSCEPTCRINVRLLVAELVSRDWCNSLADGVTTNLTDRIPSIIYKSRISSTSKLVTEFVIRSYDLFPNQSVFVILLKSTPNYLPLLLLPGNPIDGMIP